MSASLLFGVDMICDLIAVSDEEPNAPQSEDLARSALNEQPIELSHTHYEERWLPFEQIGGPAILLGDVQRSWAKNLVVPVRALLYDYRHRIISVKRSTEDNTTDSATEDAIGEENC